jgi:hypothetical protein
MAITVTKAGAFQPGVWGGLLANGFCSPTRIADFEAGLKTYRTQFTDKNTKKWDRETKKP